VTVPSSGKLALGGKGVARISTTPGLAWASKKGPRAGRYKVRVKAKDKAKSNL
jgi:hypothetical protein